MNLLAILAVISVTGVYARDDKIIEDHVRRKCEMEDLSHFKVEDKVNIWCCDCPAGHFMDAACNNTNNPFPICKQCEYSDNKQTFMDKINHSHDCYVSRKSCDDVMNTWLKHGNSKEDNTCECNDGYYRETDEGYCKKHTSCSKGFGVIKWGTESSDTVCVKCVGNKFSDVESSTEECKPHSKCKSGQKLVFGGNSSSDVACLDVVLPSPDSNSSTPTESITTAVEDQVATEFTTFPIPIKRESSISSAGIAVIIIIVVLVVIGIGCCCKKYSEFHKYCRKNNANTENDTENDTEPSVSPNNQANGDITDSCYLLPLLPSNLETESHITHVEPPNSLVDARESAGDANSDPGVNDPLLPPDNEGGNSQEGDAITDVVENINHVEEGLSTADEQGMEPADEEDADSSEEVQLTGEEDFREDTSADNKAEREITGDHSENDDRETINIDVDENVLENNMRLYNPELFPEHFHEEISAYDQGRVDEVLQSHETGEAMLCGEHGLYNEIRTEDLKKFIRDKNLLRHLQIEDLEQENKEKQEMRSKMMICVAQNLGRKLTPKYLFELAVKYEPQYIYDTMYKVFTSTLNQQPH